LRALRDVAAAISLRSHRMLGGAYRRTSSSVEIAVQAHCPHFVI